MKTVAVEKSSLDACVTAAQRQRVVLTRQGRPVALMVGLSDMDEEQLELGSSDTFWKLITARRKEKTISRAALEKALEARTPPRPRSERRRRNGSPSDKRTVR
jgi:antitoxin (DNA-binding transcriptional repressor) of toxin-antitoxin stability system